MSRTYRCNLLHHSGRSNQRPRRRGRSISVRTRPRRELTPGTMLVSIEEGERRGEAASRHRERSGRSPSRREVAETAVVNRRGVAGAHPP